MPLFYYLLYAFIADTLDMLLRDDTPATPADFAPR